MGFMTTVPAWLQRMIIAAIQKYLPPEVLAAYWHEMLVALGAWAKTLAADTTNQVDDAIAAAIADLALGQCSPSTQVLCDMIEKGEVAVVAFLRAQAARTETKLDDAMVDLVADALGVPRA
jgi:microcompartment protein CcmK/EutM